MGARPAVLMCCLSIALALAARSVRQQNDRIMEELAEIRQLLPQSTVGTGRIVRLAAMSGRVLGAADAPVTIVEFADLQCPYCRQYHKTTFGRLKTAYIDAGKVRYMARD